jgi:multiple sugar transport system permease protein
MKSNKKISIFGGVATQVFLILISLTILFPVFWMLTTSLKQTGSELSFPPQWIPNPVEWKNYLTVFTSLPFGKFILNSFLIAGLCTIGQVFIGSMVAFSFAQMRFPGRDKWFMVCLSSIMLPDAVILVPSFIMFSKFGWVDSILPLVVPAFFGGKAFYIFLARQFFKGIPKDLFDAARVDGCNSLRLWWNIAMPLSKPMLITIGLLRFLAEWNDFMGPLLYLRSMENRTLAVGLFTFMSQYGGEWNYLMAATTIMALPLIIIFLFTQKYFVEGIATSGLAGR